ncbi:MAG: sensor domain-containing diguanylate cyclase [Thermotaleaceae bacterium]
MQKKLNRLQQLIGITILSVLLLSLTTVHRWDIGGMLWVVGLGVGFNAIFLCFKVTHVDYRKKMQILLLGNFFLCNLFLYYTRGLFNDTHIPLFMLAIGMAAVFCRTGQAFGMMILCLLISFYDIMDSPSLWNRLGFLIYLFGVSFWIGLLMKEVGHQRLLLGKTMKGWTLSGEIGKAIEDSPSADEALKEAAKAVAEILEAPLGLIFSYDETKDIFIGKGGHGASLERIKSLGFYRGKGMEGRLLEEASKGIYIHQGHIELSWDNTVTYQSVMVVPLSYQNKMIGAMSVYHPQKQNWGETEKELLHRASWGIGMLLENERLLGKLQRSYALDGVTGLLNYKHFYEKLRKSLLIADQEQQKLFLLLVDIDKFKRINERLGHLVGDRILAEIGTIIKTCIGEKHVGARYGGEEFTIILLNESYERAGIIADDIRRGVKELSQRIEPLIKENLNITVSIGMACYPDVTNNINHLIDIANVRMYKGKELGGDRVVA